MPNSPTRPNVVVLTLHDAGSHFGCYGVPDARTPAIDQLAAEGVRLEHFFAAAPICSASRCAMLTGRHPQRNGVLGVVHPPDAWRLRDDVPHLASWLADAGYRTAQFGVQHEAWDDDIDRLGFAERHAVIRDETVEIPAPAVAAVFDEWLGNQDGVKPFYAQIGFFESHRVFSYGGVEADESADVWVPPYLKDVPAARADLAHLRAAVARADEGVAAVVEALRRHGLERDTIFLFNSDHGIEFPRAKWTMYDPGLHVGMIARWPGGGVDGGRAVATLASSVDIVPTLCDLIGIDSPKSDGRSMAADWRGGPAADEDAAVFALMGGSLRAVRTRRWKLIRNFEPIMRSFAPVDMSPRPAGEPGYYGVDRSCPFVELYDLDADPVELHNLADDPAHAATRAALDDRLIGWMRQQHDELLEHPVTSPYYGRAVSNLLRARPE
jgi:arylsulfatase A-like enzyme